MRCHLLSALALILVAPPAAAQGWIELERPRLPGPALPNLLRTSSEVRVAIDGPVAQVEVEERFQNTGGGLAEGSYLYPLPGEAVFRNFSLWMGEQELKGEVLNAEQARGIYEEIVRRKRDPALLSLAGHGLVRAQVFPIQPGETRKIVLRYTQLLERSGDALRIRYALGTRGGAAGTWRLSAPDEETYGAPYSPTHPLVTRRADGRLEVAIDTRDGGDIDLFLPLRRGLVGMSVLANASPGEDGYAMLLLAPPAVPEGQVIPRDLTLVVDVSGSMSGQKLDQAKAALRQALGTLRPEDRFRLIAFSTSVRSFREGWTPATPEARQQAGEFVDNLEADGGTNIAGALDQVLGSAVPEGRLPIVLFMTDGVPSVGEQQPDRIAATAASRVGRTRIFTIGLGPDVNTYLLDRLAQEGHGAVEYVAPDANVEEAVGRLVAKLQRPALVDLRIVESPVPLADLTPARLPDLFYGEELVVFGRYHGEGSGRVVIEGERNGHRERFTAQASFPGTASGNDFIPRLWASRRIGDLTRQIRLEGPTDAVIQQVRDLGLRYGILTEYTSYLVQEPGLPSTPMPVLSRLGVSPPMPANAPSAQTGTEAFLRAKESGALSGAANVAEADAVAERKASALLGSRAVRRAGGRVFLEVQGVWTDVSLRDSVPTLAVAPFSQAYFEVARAVPELGPMLGVGDSLVVAGRRVALKVDSAGRETLRPDEVEAFAKAFRGA
ncbi:MAG TPA: VIT domain-containing protein [Gemmatimonadales bacterium]|nr:VIT domain-containing protein [Gemmatimonadales bacterium]